MSRELSIDQKFIDKLDEILALNLENEHFGVSELAIEMGVSRSQLHRKINSFYGNSTSQFIREYRLKKAMVMLQENVATVSEIAYSVGFSSPTYFNTCFREYYGYPPGEVKFRNPLINANNEDGRLLQQKNTIKKTIVALIGRKISLNKEFVLLVSIVISVLMAMSSYYYFKSKNENGIVKNQESRLVTKSIAILPIKNWSGNPELEYISDGMTDAVISRLTKIKSIVKVVPLTSVLKYKNSDKSIPIIANELGVQNILQGNFQLSGDQIKIGLQLIEGTSNRHFWSQEYSGKWNSDDIFKIQAEVAESVAKNMNIEVKDEEIEAMLKSPTQNQEAYNYWLQANFQASKRTKAGMENAVPLFENAIALDSTFIEAYSNLAYLYLIGGAMWGVYKEKEAWSNIKQLTKKITQLDSTNLVADAILHSGLYLYEWDFNLMEKEYYNNAFAIPYLIQTGRYGKSLTRINRHLQRNPTNGFMYAIKAEALFFLKRQEEAINLLNKNSVLFMDDMDYSREAAKWYFYLGEYENSKILLKKTMTIFPDRPPVLLWLNAVHEYMEGSSEGVEMQLGELQKKYEEGASGSPAWFIALYHCVTKDYESVFHWLKKSYDRHEVEMIWLREEPLLIPLRNDKRYIDLYTKVGFPMEPYGTPELIYKVY